VLLELLKRHVALEDDEIETIVADRNHSPEQPGNWKNGLQGSRRPGTGRF
jgi:hypothetical protein